MVRHYKRKSERGKWTEESMKNAVVAVLENKMGYMLAAKTYSVPQTTLERKVKICSENNNEIEKMKVPLGPRAPVFSPEEEKQLVNYLLDMERFYGLTTKEIKGFVYQLAVQCNKPNPFNSDKAEAGKDWYIGFLRRHPGLKIRKPENISFDEYY